MATEVQQDAVEDVSEDVLGLVRVNQAASDCEETSSWLRVEVVALGGDVVACLLVKPHATVRAIKNTLANVEGTLVSNCNLSVSWRGDELSDTCTAEDCGLFDKCQVTLVRHANMRWNEDNPYISFQEDASGMNIELMTSDETHDSFDVLISGADVLTQGRHYWEIQILRNAAGNMLIGVARPGLQAKGEYHKTNDAWFMLPSLGTLFGDGSDSSEAAHVKCSIGDRVGILLDLDEGSVSFFRNGIQHCAGFPPGSIKGAVVAAVQLLDPGDQAKLLWGSAFPTEF